MHCLSTNSLNSLEAVYIYIHISHPGKDDYLTKLYNSLDIKTGDDMESKYHEIQSSLIIVAGNIEEVA